MGSKAGGLSRKVGGAGAQTAPAGQAGAVAIHVHLVAAALARGTCTSGRLW